MSRNEKRLVTGRKTEAWSGQEKASSTSNVRKLSRDEYEPVEKASIK